MDLGRLQEPVERRRGERLTCENPPTGLEWPSNLQAALVGN